MEERPQLFREIIHKKISKIIDVSNVHLYYDTENDKYIEIYSFSNSFSETGVLMKNIVQDLNEDTSSIMFVSDEFTTIAETIQNTSLNAKTLTSNIHRESFEVSLNSFENKTKKFLSQRLNNAIYENSTTETTNITHLIEALQTQTIFVQIIFHLYKDLSIESRNDIIIFMPEIMSVQLFHFFTEFMKLNKQLRRILHFNMSEEEFGNHLLNPFDIEYERFKVSFRNNPRNPDMIKFNDIIYQIVDDEIGKGGFGSVHKLIYFSPTESIESTDFVIKLQPNDLEKNSNTFRELQISKYLMDLGMQVEEHHIVLAKAYHFWGTNAVFGTIFDRYEGDLIHMVSNNETFKNYIMSHPQAFLEQLTRDLLSAFQFLYNKIVHADIKPENVFVKNNRFYLGDLGCAVYAEDSFACGTPTTIPIHYSLGDPMLKTFDRIGIANTLLQSCIQVFIYKKEDLGTSFLYKMNEIIYQMRENEPPFRNVKYFIDQFVIFIQFVEGDMNSFPETFKNNFNLHNIKRIFDKLLFIEGQYMNLRLQNIRELKRMERNSEINFEEMFQILQ
jgi:hypothetical protein